MSAIGAFIHALLSRVTLASAELSCFSFSFRDEPKVLEQNLPFSAPRLKSVATLADAH